jgi:hypothetical protein
MFIIEGLVYYLPPEAFKKSLTGISETAVAGSRLFFDFLHLDALSNEITMPGLETLLVVSAASRPLYPHKAEYILHVAKAGCPVASCALAVEHYSEARPGAYIGFGSERCCWC